MENHEFNLDEMRIKGSIEDYKAGRIDKKELVLRGIKGLGKKFVGAMISRFTST